jgi:HK97 family phage prohead protease
MEADFSGYATKAGLKCSDGLVIMPDAFKHQDTMQVPLVWQHGHTDVENVLGHAILENREDGVYTYGYFNQTTKAHAARELLQHGDIKMMSIWANDLIKRADRVLHGAIREVSLVLSGANPGAVIESVTIQHGDMETELEDEAIIYTGLEIELMHSDADADEDEESDSEESDDEGTNDEDDSDDSIEHADMADGTTADGPDEETIADIVDSMSEKQQDVLHYLVGEAISAAESGSTDTEDSTTLQQDHLGQQDTKEKEGDDMGRNVFEDDKTKEGEKTVLSHSDIAGIVADATKNAARSRTLWMNYALEHGIHRHRAFSSPRLWPRDNTPEWSLLGAPTGSSAVLGGVKQEPLQLASRLVHGRHHRADEARAKGYITGTLKKEEFFKVAKRVTTPDHHLQEAEARS